MNQDIRITDREGVRWIAIERPDTKNALTSAVLEALIAAIEGARGAAGSEGEGHAIRVIVLSGSQGNFCSGLDLKAAMRRGPLSPQTVREEITIYYHGVIRALRGAGMPTIAAVDGAAAGFGCDLALACDLRLLSERGRFGEVFVRRGLMPDGGGTWILPRLVGLARAFELLYTGDIIDAGAAVRMGLANHVFPTPEFEEQVWNMAIRLAKGPPGVYRLIKESVYAGLGGDLDQALEREREGQIQCLQSRDFAEGVSAFLAKREPRFTGK
jgi:2-(1,2-epoxy-1,2-dihydrophenyl)acetyl-CoA isomerase